jgi:cell division protein FtsI (penicillin-binding protein 3)
MSAPTVERTRQQTARPATSRAEAARRAGSGREASGRAASGRAASDAVGRAYARKAGRARPATEATRTAAIDRSRFVLLVMGLLGSGLVASLWLSTSAAADSYRLDAANRATRDLSERSETLRSEIAALRSAPALARASHDLGMVPAP